MLDEAEGVEWGRERPKAYPEKIQPIWRAERPRPPVKWTREWASWSEGGREKKTGETWSRMMVWLKWKVRHQQTQLSFERGDEEKGGGG